MSLSTGTFIASVTILWPYTFLYTLKLIYNYGKFSRDLQTQYKIEIVKKSEKKLSADLSFLSKIARNQQTFSANPNFTLHLLPTT